MTGPDFALLLRATVLTGIEVFVYRHGSAGYPWTVNPKLTGMVSRLGIWLWFKASSRSEKV